MKISRITLFLSILATTGLLLTACSSATANVTDKKGKSISVSSPDADTYTFKLTSEQTLNASEEETYVVEEAEPQAADSVSSNSADETEEASEGPKTGEP